MTAKRRMAVILLALLMLGTVWRIWAFSAQTPTESAGLSDRVADCLQPILNPTETVPDDLFRYLVRKAAHLTEYAVLACEGCLMVLCLFGARRAARSPRYLIAVCFCAVVAAIDEGIQLYYARGASVSDVLLDTAGAAFAAGIWWLVTYLLTRQMGRIPSGKTSNQEMNRTTETENRGESAHGKHRE